MAMVVMEVVAVTSMVAIGIGWLAVRLVVAGQDIGTADVLQIQTRVGVAKATSTLAAVVVVAAGQKDLALALFLSFPMPVKHSRLNQMQISTIGTAAPRPLLPPRKIPSAAARARHPLRYAKVGANRSRLVGP